MAPTAAAGELLPLETLQWSADVAGPFAEITLHERFRNTSPDPIDAVYVLPLAPGAAVDGMWMRIETREVRGEIRGRDEARRVYEAARDEGRVAALAESLPAGLFTQDVANLPPGAAIDVEVRLVQPVARVAGEWTLPVAVSAAPRFVPVGGRPQVVVPSRDTGVRASLAVTVHAATGVRRMGVDPAVPSSRADLLGSRARLELVDLPLDQDLVVTWTTGRARPQASLLATPTHAMLLVEGAERGAGRRWDGLQADWSGCPVSGLTSTPWAIGDEDLFHAIGLRAGPCEGVVLSGTDRGEGVRVELAARPLPRPRALATAWARARVAVARSEDEVRELGLAWGIVTSQTSFVAVDPGAAGVKAARMAGSPSPAPDPGPLDAERAAGDAVFYKSKTEISFDDAPVEGERARPAAAYELARRRPWEKTPLLAAGALLVAGGAAACAVTERGSGRGVGPACVGGLLAVGVGAGAVGWGTILQGRP